MKWRNKTIVTKQRNHKSKTEEEKAQNEWNKRTKAERPLVSTTPSAKLGQQ